ncbi:MAG: hypothetical protein JWO80_3525 [Bryobacterales bacterium]|nr:hypothetical protein [Bryobacterales bacterium]
MKLFLLVCVAFPACASVDFDRDIRPILSDNCYTCHGPDEQRRMANLRFDTKDGGAFRTLVPGDSGKSKLYQRISATSKAQRMPPPGATTTLNEKQIELIKQWIDQGAKWELHWSYVAPRRLPPPVVTAKKWVRNPVDNFILARLEQENLKPAPEADKATLLRRVTLDLTGLPPTPAELDSFLADKSPNAYDTRVDRLLASPRYGERMAMQWLDLARYADTHGYHIDSHREMWHWRDWVIDAFNRNKPYDQFTIEQLAGDLLPNATTEQKLATGFNRNHMINFEGGAIPEEYQVEYVIDRVEATSNVWMGTTMGCARCHDHKYDPIKQKEFYRFFAFFNTIPEKGLDGRKGNAEPMIQLPSDRQAARLAAVNAALEEKQKVLDEKHVAALEAAWETGEPKVVKTSSPRDGLLAHYELDGSVSDSSGNYHSGRLVAGDVTYSAGAVNKNAEFDGQTQLDLGQAGDFDSKTPFSIAVWLRENDRDPMTVLQKAESSKDRRGYELSFDEAIPIGDLRRGAKLSFKLIHKQPDDLIEISTRRRLPTSSKDPGQPKPWYHVALNYDGSAKASGLKLYINGKLEEVDVVHDHLSGSIRTPGSLQIGNKELAKPYKGSMDDLRIYSRELNPDEVEELAVREPARATLLIPAKRRGKDQAALLRDFYLTYVAPEPYRRSWLDLQTLKAEKQLLDDTIPTSMVMADMSKPRDSFVLGRGDYRNQTEKVTPGVPAVLPPLPKDAPANRLTLARWLVDPAHPLTARVAVNRYWQMYFGAGIVKTTEDFGSQGDPPSHPELLDWLATEFVRTGWDVKAMQKLIVTSAAYRQSSKATPELIEKDPDNRLLARGPRFRLPAETVRDNALAISGILKERVGGPSVFPYQPVGLWEDTAFGDVYSAQSYTPSHGDDLYRRSMYSFWKRTSGPPALITFDAPDREKCTARRLLTNTPLQALVLMNDPTYVESARWLAQRMIAEGGADPGKRIRLGFRLATARVPRLEEVQVLRDLEEKELAQYRRDREAARKLLAVGESKYDPKLDPSELAAWTTVASTILNLDETISKE